MAFMKLFGAGFALTMGMEVAIGLCFAVRTVYREARKK